MDYYIYEALSNTWLQDDEHTFSPHFFSACAFTDHKLAEDIRIRESVDGHITYVLGLQE